jgi:hypothetical protein
MSSLNDFNYRSPICGDEFKNLKSKIANNESPALNNAGLSSNPFRLVLRERLAELFSGLFYVAASRLNSPRLLQT